MTENEAVKRMKYRIDTATDIAGKGVDEKAYEDMEMAIKSLEEIQQYRAIETEIRERYHANVDIKELVRCFIETIFKGEKHEGFCILTNKDAKMWEEYRAIGTVEECREAREKQRAKKPLSTTRCKDGNHPLSQDIGRCPSCKSIISENML